MKMNCQQNLLVQQMNTIQAPDKNMKQAYIYLNISTEYCY